ncbi:polysaccharide deacetylase family protein [Flavihumibacter profundi]|jgi:peptidoglycan/xylan/chitin deacetylase (PgdA/CDA1 family)|uniref:polysaccharide deacetylase family protein n=1 Tax=Flavihumibacter profundi TaxID=2716883 RepID=UPI001CC3DD70|nr:polysaccharide deacetylase family protein [Flavihumibacter profundi]MBZ5858318.1 polysaccharide deacetylase family protein [Flavihumibacter profundi]
MQRAFFKKTLPLIVTSLLVVVYSSFIITNNSAKPEGRTKIFPLRYIYLTFDDGPLKGSENIDSVILAERLKINVFLVGEHAEKSRQLDSYYKLYEQNPFVEACNHSYSHANGKYTLFYSNPKNVLADIQKNEQLLKLRYKIVRLPGRNMWRIGNRKKDDEVSGSAAADLLAENGYSLYGWDIEWQHNATDGRPLQTVEQMLKEIESRLETGNTFTKDHIVVLLHDEMFQKKWEESELKQLLDKLRLHENYVFEHIRFYPRNFFFQ